MTKPGGHEHRKVRERVSHVTTSPANRKRGEGMLSALAQVAPGKPLREGAQHAVAALAVDRGGGVTDPLADLAVFVSSGLGHSASDRGWVGWGRRGPLAPGLASALTVAQMSLACRYHAAAERCSMAWAQPRGAGG